MKDTIAIVIALAALVVAGLGFFGGDDTATFGGSERTTITNPVTMESDNDTELFYVDYTNDRLGVSTSSPDDLVHIEDGSATTTLLISSGGSSVGGEIVFEDHDGAGCTSVAYLNGAAVLKTVTCPF